MRGNCVHPHWPMLTIAILASLGIAGCKDESEKRAIPLSVEVQSVNMSDYAPSFTLTGEVAARVQSDLSFRITGRLIERNVDVGSEVRANDILARLDPTEQIADVEAAKASVAAAEAKIKQVSATFERQKALLSQGFTTRRDYDNAVQDNEGAKASLDNANAQLATARDQLDHAELRAPANGVITARYMEAGQVAQSAQKVFTMAEDGPRDILINVQESLVAALAHAKLEVTLVSDPRVVAQGIVREITPAIDTATGTVRVKVGIDAPPKEMGLGTSVTVMARGETQGAIMVPWSSLTSDGGQASVWVVDPASKAVTMRRVAVQSFENSRVVVKQGLQPNDLVVTKGTQLLRSGQTVNPIMRSGT